MFVTHDLSVVKYISDDILVMYLGTMVEKAPAEELFANPMHPYTKALLSAIPEPDIHKKSRRIILQGEITSPIDPKPGCRFMTRCQYASGAVSYTHLNFTMPRKIDRRVFTIRMSVVLCIFS